MTCRFCGGPKRVDPDETVAAHRHYCRPCVRSSGPQQLIRGRAGAAVQKAIREGKLLRPTAYFCVDCGAQATEYDHRDYTKPLDVDPVCRSCNHRRGPADVLRAAA